MKLASRDLLALVAALAAAPASAAPERMECARLVPAATVTRYLRGATLTTTGGTDRTVVCDATVDDRPAAQVSFLCRPSDTLGKLEERMKRKKRRPVPDVGRAAFGDARRIAFWDDDTECEVEVVDHAAGNAVALAREVSRALRPEALPPLPKARYTLSCERLLPETLRAKWAQGSTVQVTYSQAEQMNCELALPGKMPVAATYTCRGGPYDGQYFSDYRKKLPKTSAAETVKVGTGGLYWTTSAAHTVSFADGETGCLVSITTFAGDKARAIALAADVERALTPESAR
jgi:hypothetical protein